MAIAILAAPLLVSIASSCLLVWFRPRWRNWRTAFLVAMPLPAIGITFATWVFASAVVTPADRCGTDACGMAMLAASGLGTLCAIAYLLSVVATAIVLRLGPR